MFNGCIFYVVITSSFNINNRKKYDNSNLE